MFTYYVMFVGILYLVYSYKTNFVFEYFIIIFKIELETDFLNFQLNNIIQSIGETKCEFPKHRFIISKFIIIRKGKCFIEYSKLILLRK